MRSDQSAGHFGLRRAGGLAAVGLLTLSLAWAAPSPPPSYGEQRVEANELKAVYLYNFLQFVQWPRARRGTSPETLVLGLLGDTPLDRSLAALQSTLSASGKRPIRVIHLGPYREGTELGSCHLLFLGESERQNFRAVVDRLGASPVLTVSDATDFLDYGGMIALVEHEGRLRWMINRVPAERAGLRFNAQMLRLAIRVLP